MAEQQILDTTLSALSLTTVGLEQNQLQSLKQKGITCLGEIYGLQPEGIAAVLGIEFSRAGEIWEKVLKVVSNPEKWSITATTKPACNLPEILISSIDSFFQNINQPKPYTILVRRFGLNGNRKYTLEDISAYLHVSRERVRQQESKGLRLLETFLFETVSQGKLFENENTHSQIIELKTEIRALRQLFANDVEPTKAEKDIHEIIEARYDAVLSENQKAYFRLLFEIFDWKYEENAPKNSFSMLPFWIIHGEFKPQTTVEAAKQIIKYLQITVVPTSYWDIKIALNKRQKNKFTDLIIRTAIKLTPDIETLDNDYFQVSFHRLRTSDQAYRVLYEKREPMGYRDIFRDVSHRLAISGEDIPAIRTVTNAMISDKKRFVSIGKSEWALTDWDDVVSTKIIDLMVQFFRKHDKPAIAKEVYDYVKSQRHVRESSITWYLGDSEKFVGIGRNLYQLAEWGDSRIKTNVKHPMWPKEKTAKLIVSIFDQHKENSLPANVLVAEMKNIMKTGSELYTVLRKSPAVKLALISENPRRLVATVVRNYIFDEKITKQEQTEEAIRSILKRQPEQTMRLTELRDLVAKKWNVNPQSVYGYVSKMIDVQKIIVEGSKTVLVTLVTETDNKRKILDTWDNEFTYDVAISYAKSNRAQAAELAKNLRAKGLKVFYDREQIPDLIGQYLLDRLYTIYHDKAHLCVILGSQRYNESDFAQYESRSARDRNFKDPGYIILIKLEKVEINFFPSTFEYLDWNEYSVDKIAELVEIQLSKRKPIPPKMITNSKQLDSQQIKILFLAANPTDTTKLRVDEEMREIDEYLNSTRFREKFEIQQGWATRYRDLPGLLQRHQPHIVHFSGHGSSAGAIIVEDDQKMAHPITAEQMQNLFRVLKDNIKCVVLNACWSETQASAISKEIDCIIGMSKSIGDTAAINFSRGFYQALGNGRNLKEAFELGKIAIDLANLGEESTPKLITRPGVDVSKIHLLSDL